MDSSTVTSIPDSQLPATCEDSQLMPSQQTSSFTFQQTIPDSQPLASQESRGLLEPGFADGSQHGKPAVGKSDGEENNHAATKETDRVVSIPDVAKVGMSILYLLL